MHVFRTPDGIFQRPEILFSTQSMQTSPTNRNTPRLSLGDPEKVATRSRQRPIKACIRCVRKKQGCDQKKPSCSRCEKRRTSCCYPEQSCTATSTEKSTITQSSESLLGAESLLGNVSPRQAVTQTRHANRPTESVDNSRCLEALRSNMNPNERSNY